MENLYKHIQNILNLGKEIIASSPIMDKETGEMNAKGDMTIAMDKKIEEAIIGYIKDAGIPADIFSEEIGTVKFHSKPEYLIAFDPLDGSTNYKIGKNFFPYGTLIAVYKGTEPTLGDVVAAGAVEYPQNLTWVYRDGKTYNHTDQRVELKNDWEIKPSTPIFLDTYYQKGYEAYRPLAQKLFIRNIGSTIGNLSYVLLNIAAGLGNVQKRPEEIGAVYALIKGAGGIAVNHRGEDLADETFSPNKTYQILGGSRGVIEAVTNMLK